ncbi:MAG: biotin--[acetyl-CoA-carboxylase] ligase [Victivallales bacterium]|jgi:BirA family biotin operon repressor/biotin-[acetyl-CoA-carboxylase] ligase|nr:biotin--[acetyl-CoA-carboxylase] ligase [Victivallales bacterium]
MPLALAVPEIIFLDEVDSTNTYARTHFDDLPDGTLVVAKNQTAGRGRRGRVWVSPPGVNFTGSVLFKQLEDGFHAGCLLGVATLALLRELSPELPAYLKWPNDIYVHDRKLAGILSESTRIEHGKITAVVSGIGVNVNLPPEIIAQIDQPATSLFAETDQKFNLEIFSKKLAKQLIRYYIIYLKNSGAIFREWKESNLLLNEVITIVDSGGVAHTGIFQDIREDGSMELAVGDSIFLFQCGDVKIDPKSVDWQKMNLKATSKGYSKTFT